MVLYGSTLVPKPENLRDEDPNLLTPFNTNDAAFHRLARKSAAQMRLLMFRGTDRGYLPKPDNLLFIADNLEDKEAERQDFSQADLNLNYVGVTRYL